MQGGNSSIIVADSNGIPCQTRRINLVIDFKLNSSDLEGHLYKVILNKGLSRGEVVRGFNAGVKVVDEMDDLLLSVYVRC